MNLTFTTEVSLPTTPARLDAWSVDDPEDYKDKEIDDCEIEVTVWITGGAKEYFSKSEGCWQPPEPPEFLIEEAYELLPSGKQVKIDPDELSQGSEEHLYELAVEKASGPDDNY